MWNRVQEAREAFRERARAYVEAHFTSVEGAMRRGQFDAAAKHAEWAMEHISDLDAQGKEVRIVAHGVDKQAQIEGGAGAPRIMIGIAVAGLPQVPQVIEVDAEPKLLAVKDLEESDDEP